MNALQTRQKSLAACIIACLSVLVLTNCQPSQRDSLPLVTEKQSCKLMDFTHITGEVFPITVEIDIPTDGSQTLLDSLTDFLNEELYDFFDYGMDFHPYESLYSKDVKHLIEHYREAYAPIYFEGDSMEYEFPPSSLDIRLVAQTDTYVTFQVSTLSVGEGIEVSSAWTTFVKSDGHRLKEVISDAEMARFYREHPEQRNNDVWEMALYRLEEYGTTDIVCNVGLLGDSLAHQYAYAPGIYENMTYPLDTIAPYLSKEAQELIKDK